MRRPNQKSTSSMPIWLYALELSSNGINSHIKDYRRTYLWESLMMCNKIIENHQALLTNLFFFSSKSIQGFDLSLGLTPQHAH